MMYTSSYTILHSQNTSKKNHITLSVIMICFGEKHIIAGQLNETLRILETIHQNIQLIVILDGKQYMKMTGIKNILTNFPSYKIIALNDTSHIPAKLFNIGLKHSHTPYIAFSWPGSTFDWNIQALTDAGLNSAVYTLNNPVLNKIYWDPPTSLIYGWLQCCKLYDLNNIIVSKAAAKKIGEFDESPLLQMDFDWEWLLRLSRHFIFKAIGTASENRLSLRNYPYEEIFEFNRDIIHRYVLRNKALPYKNTSEINTSEMLFIKDLPSTSIEKIKSVCIDHQLKTYSKPFPLTSHRKRNYKITIISGFWDYHHCQLCFLNYLDKLYGKRFATYKILMDTLTTPEDIYHSDLVIIVRGRHSNILSIIDICKKNEIPTLYMIDDNWFTIAEDYPEEYGQLFAAGSPEYDTFISALNKSDAVITYNRNLYTYLNKYNSHVILFPLNINFDFYYKEPTDINNSVLTIGYAGSLRYDDTAFKALSNIAKKNPCISIILFGVFTQSQLAIFDGIPVQVIDFMPYPIFCQVISKIAPDILIAPLMYNKTSESKCPNKYLEIGAVGAAGIYTNIHPYNDVVKDGVTGLLVKENTLPCWERNILMLVKNKKLLKKIQSTCQIDVKKNYDTCKLTKSFMQMIDSIIKNKRSIL